jgi:hypothetical protein
MEQPLFPVQEGTAPAVLLGSGPGPAPALDLPGRTTPVPPIHPAAVPPQRYYAILDQLERFTGLRGWMLSVHAPRNVGVDQSDEARPRHHFSRAGTRPPLLEARLTALQTLGYEPADHGEAWRWQEAMSLDGKHVVLFAGLDVVQLPHHREAAL